MKFISSWSCASCWNQKVDELKICDKGTLQNERNSLLQVFATVSGGLSIMGLGTMIGWSSPSVPYLTSPGSELKITVDEGVWITSLPNVGLVLGYLIIPLLINRLGRKYTMLAYATLQIISWIIIIFSNSFAVLCSGRIITGIGVSGSTGATTVYLGEIAEKRVRGMLTSFMVVFSDLGIFTVASLGAYVSYNTMNLVLLSIPLLHVITFVFMPESPYFYLMQGRDEEAVTSLMRLRGLKNADQVLQSEIEEIKMALSEIKNSEKSNLRQLFFKRSNLKAFVIVICAASASLSSGSVAMLAYAQEIFSYSGFSLTPSHSFMILVAVKIIAGLGVTQLMELIGRKILLLSSGVPCSVAIGVIGLFFFYKYHLRIDVSSISWLPLLCLISFQIAAAVGIGPLPYVLSTEFFSIEVKQAAIPACFMYICLISFLTELMFPLVNRSVGIYVSFWIFATCCFTGSIFVFCVMPETKGKSLEEIQSSLDSKK